MINKLKTIFLLIFIFIFKNNYFDRYLWKEKTIVRRKKRNSCSIMVIRKYPYGMGILSCYLSFLGNLAYCLKNDIVPYIDTKTHFYPLLHNSKKERKKVNAWSYYFKDVCHSNDKRINNYRKIIYSSGFTPKNAMVFFNKDIITPEELSAWIAVDSKYIALNDFLLKRFNDSYASLLEGKRTIGVIIREGYIVLANNKSKMDNGIDIKNHPVQLDVDELCSLLANKLIEWNCEYIFVAAETDYVIDRLTKEFGNKILSSERERLDIKELNLKEYKNAQSKLAQKLDRKTINYEYLEEVFLLSKCTCLLANKCSASIVAALWNREQYEHIDIVQKGVY